MIAYERPSGEASARGRRLLRAPRRQSRARSFEVDTRSVAEATLVLAATTNFIVALFMAPLYGLLAAEKTVSCLANDVVLIVSNMADPGGDAAFVLGTKAQQNATNNAVGMCLSQQMGETLREVNTRAGDAGSEVGLIIGQISDLVQRVPFEPLQHGLDAAFAWAIGVVTGMMDMLQSSDLEHCKLPVVGGGALFECVCRDAAAVILSPIRYVHSRL